MMVINETMGMSYITIVSQCDFQTNSMDKAIMSAASFIGKSLKFLIVQKGCFMRSICNLCLSICGNVSTLT